MVIAAVTLSVAIWGHATGRPWQSMAFLALGATQLAVAAGSRVRPGTLANLALPAAIAASLALQLGGLYLPFLRDLLHTQPLPATDLLIVLALSTLGYAAVRLDRVLHRDKAPHDNHAPPPACTPTAAARNSGLRRRAARWPAAGVLGDRAADRR